MLCRKVVEVHSLVSPRTGRELDAVLQAQYTKKKHNERYVHTSVSCDKL